MQRRPLHAVLGSALAAVESEAPEACQHMRQVANGVRSSVHVDEECFQLDLASAGREIATLGDCLPQVEIALSRDTFHALLGAELTLEEALLSDRLLLRGQHESLLALGEALAWFLRGMLRTSSADSLWEELQAQRIAEAST
jgi:hypothetical protein